MEGSVRYGFEAQERPANCADGDKAQQNAKKGQCTGLAAMLQITAEKLGKIIDQGMIVHGIARVFEKVGSGCVVKRPGNAHQNDASNHCEAKFGELDGKAIICEIGFQFGDHGWGRDELGGHGGFPSNRYALVSNFIQLLFYRSGLVGSKRQKLIGKLVNCVSKWGDYFGMTLIFHRNLSVILRKEIVSC